MATTNPAIRFLVLTMGYNYYTSGDIGMAEIVDEQFMHDFFEWLSEHADYFYGWSNMSNIALLFSQQTLDFLDKGSWEGYAYHDEFLGIAMMLMESNIPFKVINEGDLDTLDGYEAVILPDAACMTDEQTELIRQYVANGGTIISINETSLYNEYGMKWNDFLLQDVFGVSVNNTGSEEICVNEYGKGKSIFMVTPIGRYYYWASQPWANYGNKNEAEYWREKLLEMVVEANTSLPFEVNGDAVVIPYEKGNEKMFRILNLNNIKLGNAVPKEQEVEIKIYDDANEVEVLDFFGEMRDVEVRKDGNATVVNFTIYTQCCLTYSLNGSALYASIGRPERGGIYFMDREIMVTNSDKAIIIGKITIQAEAYSIEGIEKVEFYIDDELKFVDYDEPYEWIWNEFAFGRHEIKVMAYDSMGNEASDEQEIWIFNL
ncbi:MAG: beta-galactosidase trimerization domain-containing protein [Candidatus Thermoplasmatota archaeon]|nr:beta-galactosidase trimerization domain-containing protein [Candidatus Thermoplasmatota archaeon]